MYKNILDILKEETMLIEYRERISLLKQQIISLNSETIKTCKF